VTIQQKRSLKVEKLARIMTTNRAVWGMRFGKMLLRNLSVPERGQVLDISCNTGYPTTEILRRMSEGRGSSRRCELRDARRRAAQDRRARPARQEGVFFRTESAVRSCRSPTTSTISWCATSPARDPNLEVALRDFARVAKLGARCAARCRSSARSRSSTICIARC